MILLIRGIHSPLQGLFLFCLLSLVFIITAIFSCFEEGEVVFSIFLMPFVLRNGWRLHLHCHTWTDLTDSPGSDVDIIRRLSGGDINVIAFCPMIMNDVNITFYIPVLLALAPSLLLILASVPLWLWSMVGWTGMISSPLWVSYPWLVVVFTCEMAWLMVLMFSFFWKERQDEHSILSYLSTYNLHYFIILVIITDI